METKQTTKLRKPLNKNIMLLITLSTAVKFLFIVIMLGLFVVCLMTAGSIIATKQDERKKKKYIKDNRVDSTINRCLNDIIF